MIFAVLFLKQLKTKETQKPPEATMRKKCIDQVNIFDLFSNHEIGKELRAMSARLDYRRDILDWNKGAGYVFYSNKCIRPLFSKPSEIS